MLVTRVAAEQIEAQPVVAVIGKPVARPGSSYTVTVTNEPERAGRRIKAGGFVLVSDGPDRARWVHPDGREVWLIKDGDATAAHEPEPPPSLELSPDVQSLLAEREALVGQIDELWAHTADPDYPARAEAFLRSYFAWSDKVTQTTARKQAALAQEKAPERQSALLLELMHLQEFTNWKTGGFEDLVRGIPDPWPERTP
jgi:hypothetical protein